MGIFIGGAQADFNSKIIVFGAFPIAYSKNKNDITLRGVPEIALIPSNNRLLGIPVQDSQCGISLRESRMIFPL